MTMKQIDISSLCTQRINKVVQKSPLQAPGRQKNQKLQLIEDKLF